MASVSAAQLPYDHKRDHDIETALALNPEIGRLDELTAGMKHAEADRAARLIRYARRAHHPHAETQPFLVEGLCDKIMV
jgi:ABC-type branched-subunit amino acid transport system ATPase component